jgi:hypothetical protein
MSFAEVPVLYQSRSAPDGGSSRLRHEARCGLFFWSSVRLTQHSFGGCNRDCRRHGARRPDARVDLGGTRPWIESRLPKHAGRDVGHVSGTWLTTGRAPDQQRRRRHAANLGEVREGFLSHMLSGLAHVQAASRVESEVP